jgi:hypothetical protein
MNGMAAVCPAGSRQLTGSAVVRPEGEIMITLLARCRVDAADDPVIAQAVAADQQFDTLCDVPGRRAPMGCPPSASNSGSSANADDFRVQLDARSARPRSLRVNHGGWLGRATGPGEAEDPITRPAQGNFVRVDACQPLQMVRCNYAP